MICVEFALHRHDSFVNTSPQLELEAEQRTGIHFKTYHLVTLFNPLLRCSVSSYCRKGSHTQCSEIEKVLSHDFRLKHFTPVLMQSILTVTNFFGLALREMRGVVSISKVLRRRNTYT